MTGPDDLPPRADLVFRVRTLRRVVRKRVPWGGADGQTLVCPVENGVTGHRTDSPGADSAGARVSPATPYPGGPPGATGLATTVRGGAGPDMHEDPAHPTVTRPAHPLIPAAGSTCETRRHDGGDHPGPGPAAMRTGPGRGNHASN